MATRPRRIEHAARGHQQQFLRLAAGNPLGIVFAYAPGIYDGNLVTGQPFAAKNGTFAENVTIDGRGMSFSGGSFRAADISPLGTSATLAAVASPLGSATEVLLSIGASGGSDNWHTLVADGNGNAYIQSRTGGTIGTATSTTVLRFTRTVIGGSFSTASRTVYINGVASTTDTTSVGVSSNDRILIGGLWRGGSVIQQMASAGSIALAVVANRPWTADEHAAFAANPWGIFERQAFIPFAASASPDVSVTLTGQSITTAQGSVAVSADKSVSLTGQSITIAQGTVSTSPYTISNITEPVANQPTTVLIPNTPASPAHCVIYCHGRGESEQNIYNQSDAKKATVDAITGAGIYMACSAATVAGIGANSWGNAGAVEAVIQLMRYMRATYSIERFVLWGNSMGGVLALNTISSGRERIHGFLGHAPVCNLANMQAGVYGSEINTAYGVGASPATYANKSKGYDPVLRQAFTMQHIPVLMAASASDGTVSKSANADTFAALLAGTVKSVTVYTATGGHIDASHFDATRDLAFVQGCLNTPVALDRPATNRTISVTLKDSAGSPRASLTGLTAAWFDQPLVSGLQYPTATYAGLSTNGSGVLSLTSVPSDLAVSSPGLLVISDTDGTTTQSPVHKIAAGPVEVS